MSDDEPAARAGVSTALAAIAMDATVLDELCPFFLVLDEQLRAVQVGSLFGRLLPEPLRGLTLTQAFEIQRPRGAATFPELARQGRGRLALLRCRLRAGITLRGQFSLLAGGRELLFFGTPAATALRDLTDVGLSLGDFPPHSAVTDYLLLAQAQAATAAEARAMAERLRTMNNQLETRVAERTARLQRETAERNRAEAERAQMEEELRLAHKLEAVGQLASGIAHEINTPIQFVGDNLRFLAEAVSDITPVLNAAVGAHRDDDRAADAADLEFILAELPRAVGESLEGLERVSRIVRAMKEFARPDGAELTFADINECVQTTLVVTRNEYADVADLRTDFDPALPPVRCIPGEINQVVLHLVVNAAHAVADRLARSPSSPSSPSRGLIAVRTRLVGESVEISVRDTGTGIAPEIRSRIFDPFFTTKEVGRGSGQGLSTSRSIVSTRHGGSIEVTSEPGIGSEFTVRLPVRGPASAGGTATAPTVQRPQRSDR